MQFSNKVHRFCHPQQANNSNYEFLNRTNEERKLSINEERKLSIIAN